MSYDHIIATSGGANMLSNDKNLRLVLETAIQIYENKPSGPAVIYVTALKLVSLLAQNSVKVIGSGSDQYYMYGNYIISTKGYHPDENFWIGNMEFRWDMPVQIISRLDRHKQEEEIESGFVKNSPEHRDYIMHYNYPNKVRVVFSLREDAAFANSNAKIMVTAEHASRFPLRKLGLYLNDTMAIGYGKDEYGVVSYDYFAKFEPEQMQWLKAMLENEHITYSVRVVLPANSTFWLDAKEHGLAEHMAVIRNFDSEIDSDIVTHKHHEKYNSNAILYRIPFKELQFGKYGFIWS